MSRSSTGIYYCFTTVIVILSIFLSSLVVKIGRTCESSNRKRVPRCLRVVSIYITGEWFLICLFEQRDRDYIWPLAMPDGFILREAWVVLSLATGGAGSCVCALHFYIYWAPVAYRGGGGQGGAMTPGRKLWRGRRPSL